MEQLDDYDWHRLLATIRRGHCILLLGPGAAVDPDDPEGTPLAIRLARTLAEKLPPGKVANPNELTHVAQAHYQYFRDRVDLEWPYRISMRLMPPPRPHYIPHWRSHLFLCT
ncbi:MAG: hypothetical protein U1F76_25695 [Candidatus Competibacteraceae bacterium]